LARIDQFQVLQFLYNEILIPPAVRDEVVRAGGERPGVVEVETVNWIQVANVQNQTAVMLLQERLDRGESEAIVLALEQEADLLLIDEARGRRVAQAQGFILLEQSAFWCWLDVEG
jgi:uncharacterized protein